MSPIPRAGNSVEHEPFDTLPQNNEFNNHQNSTEEKQNKIQVSDFYNFIGKYK